ncbi:hypothetical protein DID75_01175 [Candidatus Marinamargulisbacteria bacterium SCGC AG-410-N11]|nr:hypothetical protein DID75_01175 [Candidatus Marinamargulisbacteria bacterium SCGC AG-410-N11]
MAIIKGLNERSNRLASRVSKKNVESKNAAKKLCVDSQDGDSSLDVNKGLMRGGIYEILKSMES